MDAVLLSTRADDCEHGFSFPEFRIPRACLLLAKGTAALGKRAAYGSGSALSTPRSVAGRPQGETTVGSQSL